MSSSFDDAMLTFLWVILLTTPLGKQTKDDIKSYKMNYFPNHREMNPPLMDTKYLMQSVQ